jgi:DNA-binding NarL/FixJ family response regulator
MISVFIVEDHTVVVEGLLALLQHEKDIVVAGTAGTAADAISFFKTKTADVVLLDINLPDMSGIELCKLIKTSYSNTMVLGLSTFNQGLYMSKLMENGASGYLLKNVTRQELKEAISTVASGAVYFSFEAGKTYSATLKKNKEAPVLTKREKEILKLIAEGFTNAQISQQLFISIDTVDTHRKNLYTKLNVKNTALLIRYAIENNFLG